MVSRRWLAASILLFAPFAVAQGCVFTLAPLAGGGAGGAGGGTGGGDGGTGGEGAAPVVYEMRVDYGSFSGSAVTDFVLMVPLDPDDIDYTKTAVDGSDLRFFDDAGAPLDHEIELWAPGGRSIAWVKLPTMTPAGGTFAIRYGDPAAPGGAAPQSLWSSYVAVHHLGEDFDADEAAADATGNGPVGTPTLVTSSVTSLIGRGAELTGETAPSSGSGSVINFGTVDAWLAGPGEQRTISLWAARRTTGPDPMQLFSTKTSCCGGWALLVLGDTFANIRSDVTVGSCCVNMSSAFDSSPFALPNQDNDMDWHHYLIVLDRVANTHSVYFDGALRDQVAFSTPDGTGASAGRIGASEYADSFALAIIDETRVGAFAADASWAALRYLAESSDGYVTFGAPQLVSAD